MQWELAGGSSEARRSIEGLPRVRRELTRSDQEVAENASRVRHKMTETHWEFAGESEKCKGLVFTHGRISFSGLWWASTKDYSEKLT
ncbi:hypothetical protein B296_00031616 [Ensete ventricosum]|uniref:Uncharacterized protein n=1 Tax=Ensete ventricosum TaxID=4639 RepID=A0A426YYR4_ENSVE|nr:hypothetical protein B296_00031616 [Ensete ventricosum]